MERLPLSGEFRGYVLFRNSRGWTHIVHLCVASGFRKLRVGEHLVEELRKRSQDLGLAGLRLKCRRDFPANAFWERAGFVAGAETAGRGKDGMNLTLWIKSHGLPDLFTRSNEDSGAAIRAVIDANVFFHLVDEDGPHTEESKALQEGWVQDTVQLCVVDELRNDINRSTDLGRRNRNQKKASSYAHVSYDPLSISAKVAVLSGILGWHIPTAQQRSDMNHIAKAAAGGISYFLTRDEELLAKSEEIEDQMEITVIRPCQFLSKLDQIEKEALYQPARLAGSGLEACRFKAEFLQEADLHFRCRQSGESSAQFLAKLRAILAKSVSSSGREVTLWRIGTGLPVALTASRRHSDGILDLEMFRIAKSPLSATVARHLLQRQLRNASANSDWLVRISDRFHERTGADAAAELHFRPSASGVDRPVIRGIVDRGGLATRLEHLLPDTVHFGIGNTENKDANLLEETYWPVKIEMANIRCASIPIHAEWARHLFDEHLSTTELFGAEKELLLSRENVYYRSPTGAFPPAPGRILWYVKHDKHVRGTKSFRACSRTISVEVAPAKDLFRRFKRLGVYTWQDLMRITDGNSKGKVMAIHFADTELFTNHVPLSFARALGAAGMIQSPCAMQENVFLEIYRKGMDI